MVKIGSFGQKWKFWSKMEILTENGNFVQNGNFAKFWSKNRIRNQNFESFLSKNRHVFCQILPELVNRINVGTKKVPKTDKVRLSDLQISL